MIKKTRHILDAVVGALHADARRKFTWNEVSYFARWWADATPEVHRRVRQLVRGRQLEFTTGGWVMNDEACVTARSRKPRPFSAAPPHRKNMLRVSRRMIGRLLRRPFSSQKSSPKRVAVVLSGCGVYDGAEITESVATLVALSRRGCEVKNFAPYQPQMHVVDHTSGEEQKEKRNALVEAARITRGQVEPLDLLDASEYDAVVFPGGFGAAKNLSTFATMGLDCGINPKVRGIIEKFHAAEKPMAFCCIAPVLAAKTLGKTASGLKLTVGCDKPEDAQGNKWPYSDAAGAVENFGATHVVTTMAETCVDENNKIVTAPAYMCDATPHEVFDSVGLMVDEVLAMVDRS